MQDLLLLTKNFLRSSKQSRESKEKICRLIEKTIIVKKTIFKNNNFKNKKERVVKN